jgi:type II secretory pathway pseudopilin PulG
MRKLAKEIIRLFKEQRGVGFIETLIALAIIGAVAVTFVNSLVTVSKANYISDEQTTAESLARSQMEWVKNISYVEEASEYTPAPILDDGDYTDYSVSIAAQPLRNPDDGLQKITITVKHHDDTLIILESYKRQK